MYLKKDWNVRLQDLNLQSSDYEPDEITNFSKPRESQSNRRFPYGYLVTTSLRLPNRSS